MNLPFIPDLKTAAVVAVVVGVAAFGGGWTANGWRLTAKHNAEALSASEGARQALVAMTAERDALALRLLALNDKHLEELKNAQTETNRLRDAGAYRLRINALCPPAKLPAQTDPAPRVDTGTGAELDSTARRAYFALRDGIDRASAQLAACQDELRLRVLGQ